MKRRVLSIILSIVMVCGLLPMTSYAATTITTVAITDMDVPIAGKTPDYAITTGVGYDVTSEFDDNIKTVSGVKWHNYTSDREMRPTETFEFGKQYAVEIFLRVENGYEFAYNSDSETSVLGTINGENANVIAKVTNNHVKDAIVVRYVFKACENPRIETIEVSGIDVPAVGKPADFEGIVQEDGHYSIRAQKGIEWYDKTSQGSVVLGDTFREGHEYEVKVWLVTDTNYKFVVDDQGKNAVTGTFNGATTEFDDTDSDTLVSLTYNFGVCNPSSITTVSVSGIDEPVVGEMPDYKAVLGGTGYQFETNLTNCPYGVTWIDVTKVDDEVVLTPEVDKFVCGHTYKVQARLVANDGYSFEDLTAGKINGNSVTIIASGEDNEYVTLEKTYVVAHPSTPTIVAKVDATCTTAGKQAYYHCDGCDKDYEDEAGTKEISDITTWGIIKATGHTIEIQNKKDATETETGYTGDEYCTTCKNVITKGKEIAKLESTTPSAPTEQTKPTEPVVPQVPAEGSTIVDADTKETYVVTKSDATNGTVAYTKPANKKVTKVKVPDTVIIDGITYKVTSIAKNAFNGCSKLTSVTIGKNVTSIGDKAFYKCTKLTKITIPSKVNKIGKSAFEGCKKLKTIKIKTTKLTSKKVGSKAFKGTPKNAKVTVPKKSLKSYKKFLYKKGLNKKATIKK